MNTVDALGEDMRGWGFQLLSLLLLIACTVRVCKSEMLSIGDQGYPHLFFLQPSTPVLWDRKTLALREAGSQAVRVNSRGIRYIPAAYSVVTLGSASRAGSHFHSESGWDWVNCTLSEGGLCDIMSDVTGQLISRVFPDAPGDVYVGSTGSERVDAILGPKCPETKTKRVLSGGDRYDVSACNVIGAGTDFVYLPYENRLYVLSDPISFQVITIISILTVIMTIVLAHNLEYSMGSIKKPTGALLSIGGMTALLLVTCFATGEANFLLPYVTLEDRLSFVALFGYVLYYTARSAIDYYVNKRERESPVNPILATLCVVPLRLYGTLDNSYTTFLTFLFATRLLHKLATLGEDVAKGIDIVVDSVLVSLLVYTGVVPQHNNDPAVVALYLLQGLFGAQTLTRVMDEFRAK